MGHRSRKELKPEEWKIEIDHGLEYRKQYGKERSWDDLEQLYYNSHNSQMHQGPNIIMSTGDALMSSLTVPDPYIRVKAKRRESYIVAPIIESLANSMLKELKVKKEVDYATIHAYLFGPGLIKQGYDSLYGYDLDKEYDNLGLSVTQFDKRGRRIEYGTDSGMPWVRAVSPHDIVVPWGTRDIDDAPWIAHRVIRHIDEIKADPKYSNKSNLQPNMSMRDFVESYEQMLSTVPGGAISVNMLSGEVEDMGDFVVLWEIRDFQDGRVKVISPSHNKFLRNELDMLQAIGNPFSDLTFTPRTRHFWVTPPAFYLIMQQAELSDIALQGTKQRRAAVLRLLANPDVIDPYEAERVLSGDVGVYSFVKQGMNPQDAFFQVPMSSQNQMLIMESDQVRRNAREQIGFSSNQFGEFDTSSRRTATEAAVVDQSSKLRLSRRGRAVATLYENVARKIINTIKYFWKTPRAVEFLDQVGVVQHRMFTGMDLEGEFSYGVSLSESPEEGIVNARNSALNVFYALQGHPAVDQQKLVQYLVKTYNDIEFASIFREEIVRDADLLNALQNMRQQNRGASNGRESQQGTMLPTMQTQNTTQGGGNPQQSA